VRRKPERARGFVSEVRTATEANLSASPLSSC